MVDFMNICVVSFKLLELFVPGVLTVDLLAAGFVLLGLDF